MSARSFRSVFMVASCAGAALGCYLVSLRVASERAALENVETKIVLAQRDLRLLQTEIGTRGRLAQLERWNVKVLALSAPSADQFLNGGFELAKMTAPQHRIDLDAPVVLASASTDAPKLQIEGAQPEQGQGEEAEQGASPRELMHVASLKRPVAQDNRDAIVSLKPSNAVPKAGPEKVPAKPAEKAAASAKSMAAAKEKPVAASTKAGAAAPSRKSANLDPLAPLTSPAKPKKVANVTSKDAAKKQ